MRAVGIINIKALACLFYASLCGQVFAQDPVSGRLLYNTAFGAGTPSCATSTCHGPDPSLNIARIQNGTTANDIFFAIERYGIMAFLRGRISNEQAADLAAYIANPAAANNLATASLSTASLSFNTIFVGQTTRSARVSLSNSSATPLTMSSVAVSSPDFAVINNRCIANTRLEVGATCAIDIAFAPTRATAHSGQLVIAHNGQGGSSVVTLSGNASALPANARLMIEYRIPALDYYVITSRPNEQISLDALPDFRRTGASFPVYATQASATIAITRYYFDQVAKQGTRGSHFYTLLADEIAALNRLNPSNALAPRLPFNEGVDSFAAMPEMLSGNNTCTQGLQPVYRLFRGNARFPDDPNHRFTIERQIYDEFVALGWSGEGIVLCVLAPFP